MSTETLSQQEIDRLFDAGAAPQPGAAAPETRSNVQMYDFRRPARISKDRQRSLEGMYAMMAKSLESWLLGRIRGQLNVELISVEQFTFAEFMLSLSTPCAAYVYDVADGHQVVIDFGRDFSFFLVDRMLGGSANFAPQSRALTALERLIVRLIADRAATLLGDIWHDHVQLDPALNRFEAVPTMLQIANHEDPVLVATLQATAGPFRNVLLVCVPFMVLEKFFTSAATRRIHRGAGSEAERQFDRVAADATLRSATMEVAARLPAWRTSLRELSRLKPGMVLSTPLQASSMADVYVAGELRFRGRPGKLAGNVAVGIAEATDPNPPDLPLIR